MRLGLILVCFLIAFSGCVRPEETIISLSFWTDMEMGVQSKNMLYANDELLGVFENALQDPICGDIGLLVIDNIEEGELSLTIRDEFGSSKAIGTVNLYSVTKGINIKSAEGAMIKVFKGLDDPCILVQLEW